MALKKLAMAKTELYNNIAEGDSKIMRKALCQMYEWTKLFETLFDTKTEDGNWVEGSWPELEGEKNNEEKCKNESDIKSAYLQMRIRLANYHFGFLKYAKMLKSRKCPINQ